MPKVFSIVLAAGLALAGAALAGAAPAVMPSPLKSVPGAYYSGRWYEIARSPGKSEHDCDGVTYDFTAAAGASFNVALTCRKGATSGPIQVTRSSGKIIDGSGGGKFRLVFLGLVPVEYWVLARDEAENSWFIMARDNGKYVWIVARRPVMETAQRNALVAKIKAMGLTTDNLEYPDQPPAAG